ncbi:hypothetical protein ANN_16320 [Periplaneta americana]|uniref:Uncharacterized protein n=1 Tax=Periplaneta americana TaxID=6978 RepID=A0ABQ8SJW9_PERAM|nr:hypothetical protein ANN_16320 [Periplaneta americana]
MQIKCSVSMLIVEVNVNKYVEIRLLPVVLHGCETWTLTLREEQRLRAFENKILRKIFGAKRDEVRGEWKKELRKRLVMCFVWSVALNVAETWTLRPSEEKRMEAFEMWIWRRMERVKWTDRIRNVGLAVLERVDE